MSWGTAYKQIKVPDTKSNTLCRSVKLSATHVHIYGTARYSVCVPVPYMYALFADSFTDWHNIIVRVRSTLIALYAIPTDYYLYYYLAILVKFNNVFVLFSQNKLINIQMTETSIWKNKKVCKSHQTTIITKQGGKTLTQNRIAYDDLWQYIKVFSCECDVNKNKK